MNTSLEDFNHIPKVTQYQSIKAYLNDYFNYRKKIDSKFTFEIWSAELNYKSRSYIKMICSCDRPATIDFICIFAKTNHFTKIEKDHLVAISKIQNSDDPFQSEVFTNKMLETFEPAVKSVDIAKHDEFFNSQIIPLIQMLLSFEDSPANADFISEMTGYCSDKTKKALEKLRSLDYIEEKEDLTWKSKIKSFKVSKGQEDESIKSFHKSTFQEASEKLDHSDQQKSFRSIYLPLSEEDYPKFDQELEKFIARIKNKFASDTLTDKKMMKINFQVYPLTKVYKK